MGVDPLSPLYGRTLVHRPLRSPPTPGSSTTLVPVFRLETTDRLATSDLALAASPSTAAADVLACLEPLGRPLRFLRGRDIDLQFRHKVIKHPAHSPRGAQVSCMATSIRYQLNEVGSRRPERHKHPGNATLVVAHRRAAWCSPLDRRSLKTPAWHRSAAPNKSSTFVLERAGRWRASSRR